MTDFNLVLSQVRQRLEILYQIVDELEQQGGGGGGTSDYTQLENLPKLNSKTITGSHDGSYYGLADAAALNDKADKSTTYTKTEVNGLLNDKADKSTTYTKTETNSYVAGEIAGAILDLDKEAVGGSTKYITTISEANGIIDATAETSDTVPTAGSDKLVRSQGIKTYVDNGLATKIGFADILGQGTRLQNVDMNDYWQPGNYYIATSDDLANITNKPDPVYSARCRVLVLQFTGTSTSNYRCVQIWIPQILGTDAGRFYMRYRTTNTQGVVTWTTWKQYTDDSYAFGSNTATVIPAAGVDLDTLTSPGVWIVSSTDAALACPGRPDYDNAASKIFRLEVKSMSSTRVFQEMYVYRIGTYEGDFDRYMRMRKTNGTWNGWKHIETTDVNTYYPPAQNNLSNSLMNTGFNAELTVEPDEDEPQDER